MYLQDTMQPAFTDIKLSNSSVSSSTIAGIRGCSQGTESGGYCAPLAVPRPVTLAGGLANKAKFVIGWTNHRKGN